LALSTVVQPRQILATVAVVAICVTFQSCAMPYASSPVDHRCRSVKVSTGAGGVNIT
jgi:hypothetical protein